MARMYVPLMLPEGIPATDEEEETRLLGRLQQNPSGVCIVRFTVRAGLLL